MTDNIEKGADFKNLTLYEKLHAMRGDVLLMDWIGDKVLPKINSKYVSKGKLLRQLAPVFYKFGVEIKYNEDEPKQLGACGSKEQHYIQNIRLTLINVNDPSEREEYNAYGEGADMMDKGLSISKAYAIRQIFLGMFNIADGIEPDDVTEYSVLSVPYKVKTPEEEQEVKSKVLEKAIPPAKKEEPKKEPAKTEVPKKEEPKEEKPADKPRKLSKIQQTAYDNACKEIDALVANMRITAEEYRTLKEARDAVVDSDTFKSFMAMKRMAVQ